MNTDSRCRSAFTLIEILVILGIVAIIAAVLIPVFLNARESGRRASCLSNMRQLGTAITLYTQDNDGAFPAGSVEQPGVGWAQYCLPYYKNVKILKCVDDNSTSDAENMYAAQLSYAINCNLSSYQISSNRQWPGFSTLRLTSPSKTAMLFEVSDNISRDNTEPNSDPPSGNGADIPGRGMAVTFCLGSGGQFKVGDDGIATRYATGNMGGRILNGGAGSTPRHLGGANYVACDGHAIWLMPNRVSSGDTSVAPDCNQGTAQSQPSDCSAQVLVNAAGTDNAAYDLTFSGK